MGYKENLIAFLRASSTLVLASVSVETMNIKMAEIAARYGMTAMSAERLMVKIGWIVDGCLSKTPIQRGYVTPDREVTPRGQGYLLEASRE